MRLGALAAVAVLALGLAGCSDDPRTGGTPGGEPTVDAPTEPTADVPGDPSGAPVDAPKVANPVQNLDKFTQSPCAMLTKAQASELGYDAEIGVPADQKEEPECKWRAETRDNFSIFLNENQPLGIAGVYQNKQQDPEYYAYFEPVDVAGFPGVLVDTYDDRPNGVCGLAVGVTDTQIISVVGTIDRGGPGQGDTCGLLKKAAEAAVATMSQG